MTDLLSERRRRVGIKGWLTRNLTTLDELISSQGDVYHIEAELEAVLKRESDLSSCQSTIECLLDSEEDILNDISEQSSLVDRFGKP